MITIGLFFLISCLNTYAMQPHGVITIPINKYTTDSLRNCGTMSYSPIILQLNHCQNLLNCCDMALESKDWWLTEFEPVCSLYTKQFLKIYNPNTHYANKNLNSQEMGEFCLRIIGLTLKKATQKLCEATHYQTSLARKSSFNSHDSRSELLRKRKADIDKAQKDKMPKLITQFSHSFDTIFFIEIETLIQNFDKTIATIGSSNSGLKRTTDEFQLFMEQFEQIITRQMNRKNESQFHSTIFHSLLHFWGLFALSYWFDYQIFKQS